MTVCATAVDWDMPGLAKLKKEREAGKVKKSTEKGAAYSYFWQLYERQFGRKYFSVSVPGDMNILSRMLDTLTLDQLLEVIHLYITSYRARFGSPQFPYPKIAGMKFKLDVLISEMEKQAGCKDVSSAATVVDSSWFDLGDDTDV